MLNLVADSEPIRLMPNSPTRSAGVNLPSSPTSPSFNTFQDILPANLIASAPPPEPPRRKMTLKASEGRPLHRAQTSPGRDPPPRNLWNVVRDATTRTKMRDVVESVTRRTSSGADHRKDTALYKRLSGDSSSDVPLPKGRGHAKQATV